MRHKDEYQKGAESTEEQYKDLTDDSDKEPEQLKMPDHSPDNLPRTQEQAVKEGEERDRLVYKADKK